MRSRVGELRELLGLKLEAIPGVAAVGIETLRGKRVAKRNRLPFGIIKGALGPFEVIAYLETPGAVETQDGAEIGGDCGRLRGRRRWDGRRGRRWCSGLR